MSRATLDVQAPILGSPHNAGIVLGGLQNQYTSIGHPGPRTSVQHLSPFLIVISDAGGQFNVAHKARH
jgi:hypothetical protein